MGVPAALGTPDEPGPGFEKGQLVVQVDPGVAGLRQQDAGFTAAGMHFQQFERLLVARLSLHGEKVGLGEPVHARQVDIGLLADVHPAQILPVGGDYAEPDPHVRRPGRGVALLVDLEVLGVDLEAFGDLHGGFVDADEGDGRVVGRPPVAGVAVHLFLRDEFRHAVADEPAAVVGQAQFLERLEVDGIEVLVANEGHVASRRTEFRVGLARFRGRQLAGFSVLQVVEEQVAVQREQQAVTAGGEVVADDAALADDAQAFASREFLFGQRLVAGDECGRVDEQPHFPVGDVVLPEVHLQRVGFLAAQERDPARIRRDLHAPG